MCATFIDFEHFIIPDEITLGGIVAGLARVVFAAAIARRPFHRRRDYGAAFWASRAGAGIVYAILRLGKLLFGRQKLKLPPETKIIFSETAVHLAGQGNSLRRIVLPQIGRDCRCSARTVELVDRVLRRTCVVRLSPSSLEIGEEKLNPDDVPCMECVSAEIVLPREAMGLGDVKFMAAIGAFIGWQGAIFSLMISSLIGAAVGVTLILLRRREWSSRMPYGPYIALAAVIWIFSHKTFFAWLMH